MRGLEGGGDGGGGAAFNLRKASQSGQHTSGCIVYKVYRGPQNYTAEVNRQAPQETMKSCTSRLSVEIADLPGPPAPYTDRLSDLGIIGWAGAGAAQDKCGPHFLCR